MKSLILVFLKMIFNLKFLIWVLKIAINYNPKHGQEKSYGPTEKANILGLLQMEGGRTKFWSIYGLILAIYRSLYD